MPTWDGTIKTQDACDGNVDALESQMHWGSRNKDILHFPFGLWPPLVLWGLRESDLAKVGDKIVPQKPLSRGQELKCLDPLRLPSAPTHHNESFWFALFFQSTRFLGFGRAPRLSVWGLFLGYLPFSKPLHKSLNVKICSLFSYRHNHDMITITCLCKWDCSCVHSWCLLPYLGSNLVPAAPWLCDLGQVIYPLCSFLIYKWSIKSAPRLFED